MSNVKRSRRPEKFNGVWCELNNKPCIHPAPDGLQNCRACSEYDFIAYVKGVEKGKLK